MPIHSLIKTATESRGVRFLFAGAVNTLFGLAVYIGCVVAGLPIWAAMLVAMLAGIAFNFVSLGGYVFRDISVRRIPRFVCGYGTIYLVNLGAFHLLQMRIASAVWCQVVLIVPMALLSYLVMSRFVFGRGAPASRP